MKTNHPFLRDAYILTLVLLAAALAIWSIPGLPSTLQGWGILLLFASAVALMDVFPIVMPGEMNEVTFSAAILIASAVLFGPAQTAWITLLGTVAGEIAFRTFILRRSWNRVLFNSAQMVVDLVLVSGVYLLFSDTSPASLNSLRDVGALALAGLIYYLTNDLLVSVVIALDQGLSVLAVWRIALRDAAWHNLVMIPLGAVLALLWTVAPWSLSLFLLPLFTMRRSMGMVREALEQTRQALIALADTIDQRDASTYRHSQRVAEYAGMIAREMGIPFDQVELIVTSARLHDLGKIGMSNDMLYKSGAFTEGERIEFRRHPAIGESLVGYFPAFSSVREIVRHHHERNDGTGYPNGKKGQEIPMGAKILAVADAYDAMTSHRPYRPAKSREQAIAELLSYSGTQFDSQVVQAFLKAMKLKAT